MRHLGILITFLLTTASSYSNSAIGLRVCDFLKIPTFAENVFLKVDYSFLNQNTIEAANVYSPELNALSFLYLYVALIGFYIAVILH